MGKGEIACYEQFLLFPQCFQNVLLMRENEYLWSEGLMKIKSRDTLIYFYAPVSKDWGHIVLSLFVHPSVCPRKLNMKT